MEVDRLSLVAAVLLGWMALVHFVLAAGVRRGELAWGGRYPRLLPSAHRMGSALYAVGLVAAGLVIAEMGGVIDLVDARSGAMRAAGWVATVFLTITGLFNIFKGSRWERMLFGPICVIGAMLAGWLTFG